MAKTHLRIMKHLDRDEIISKLIIGISTHDVHDWLKAKYSTVSEHKYVISEKAIKAFKDDYLDIYNMIQEDLVKTKKAIATSTEDELELAVKNNSAYHSKMVELAGKELDIKSIIIKLAAGIETRLGQIFDEIQEDPRNINTRVDRLLIEYADSLAGILEKYHKFTATQPDTIIQNNNITLQVVDQHISVFHDVIKEVLSQMDLDSSLYFMEIFNEKMSKLKPAVEKDIPNTDIRLAEAKVLNETITKKLSE